MSNDLNNDEEILIISPDQDQFRGGSTSNQLQKIPVSTLTKNIEEFLSKIGTNLDLSNVEIPNGKVSKLILTLGVTGTGQISILGTGGSVAANGSISVHIDLE